MHLLISNDLTFYCLQEQTLYVLAPLLRPYEQQSHHYVYLTWGFFVCSNTIIYCCDTTRPHLLLLQWIPAVLASYCSTNHRRNTNARNSCSHRITVGLVSCLRMQSYCGPGLKDNVPLYLLCSNWNLYILPYQGLFPFWRCMMMWGSLHLSQYGTYYWCWWENLETANTTPFVCVETLTTNATW